MATKQENHEHIASCHVSLQPHVFRTGSMYLTTGVPHNPKFKACASVSPARPASMTLLPRVAQRDVNCDISTSPLHPPLRVICRWTVNKEDYLPSESSYYDSLG